MRMQYSVMMFMPCNIRNHVMNLVCNIPNIAVTQYSNKVHNITKIIPTVFPANLLPNLLPNYLLAINKK